MLDFFKFHHRFYFTRKEANNPVSRLVGALILEGGENVVIHWPDGSETYAVYADTYGYTNLFRTGSREIKLSNYFMRMKGIRVSLADSKKTP